MYIIYTYTHIYTHMYTNEKEKEITLYPQTIETFF